LVSPTPENAGFGAIKKDSRIAPVTFNVPLPETEPEVAVMIVDPTATVWASPEDALTVAMVGVFEVQLTLLVKSAVLVSLNVPVALNCWVSPFGRLGVLGVTAMDSNPLTKVTRAVLVVPLTK
jgi:hypothetical protein